MVTIYPSLKVSANGAVALLDLVDQGFKVVSIPDLTVRVAGTYQDVVDVVLSPFGESLGMRTATGDLVVVQDGQRQSYALPGSRDRIRGYALSDAGDRLALVLADEAGGTLEVWSLPAGDAPLATTALPRIDRGFVTASPGLTRVGVVATTMPGDGPRFRAIYDVPTAGARELRPLWTEEGTPLPGTALALSDEWAWIAGTDGLVGWRGAAPPVTLPGTPAEQLIFSPTGSHLLASRVARLAGVTGAEMLFRLFDLTTLTEVARAVHVVENDADAHAVVSPDLTSLLILRATRTGEVIVEERDLSRSG